MRDDGRTVTKRLPIAIPYSLNNDKYWIGGLLKNHRFIAIPLPAFQEAFAEKVVEFGDVEDFLSCDGGVIFDSAKLNFVVFEHDIAASGVGIAGLSDASDVDHQFLVAKGVGITNLAGRIKSEILGENARDMGVSLEAVFLDEAKNPFDFALVIDVFREHIFVEGAAW